MIHGNINNICLSLSSFERLRTEDKLYVDKTRMIENFLNSSSAVQLIARQRRLGKSMNMDMLRCFLTDKEDLRHLFEGLYIETSPVWEMAHSSPAFYFDFKALTEDYRREIVMQVYRHVSSYVNPESLTGYFKLQFDHMVNNPEKGANAMLLLTEIFMKQRARNPTC